MQEKPASVKIAWAMVADILKALERIEREDARRAEAAKFSKLFHSEEKKPETVAP